MRRMLGVAARLLVLCGSVILAVPPLALLSVAETAEGLALAGAALAGLAALALVAAGGERFPRVIAAMLAAALLLGGYVAARAPDGESIPGSGMTSHHEEPHAFSRWELSNLLPELDHMKMTGTRVGQLLVGPALQHCLVHTIPLQRDMKDRPEYARLGTAMGDGYARLLGRPRPGLHWWRYVPPSTGAGERLPVLIFVHGWGANYKTYFHAWKPFADRMKMAVVMPTLGFGELPGVDHGLEPFLAAWARDPTLDLSRAWIAGLSNGALRAVRAAGARPGAYRGVVLISPIAPAVRETGMRSFKNVGPVDLAPYPPVLVIHGGHDQHTTPLGLIASQKASLGERGVAFTSHCYEGIDHHLIYRETERMHAHVMEWMGAR